MAIDLHVGEDSGELTLGRDERRSAQRAGDLFSVHHLVAVRAVELVHLGIGVGQKWKSQALLFFESAMARDRVAAHTEDHGAALFEGCGSALESNRLARAAGRVVSRVK